MSNNIKRIYADVEMSWTVELPSDIADEDILSTKEFRDRLLEELGVEHREEVVDCSVDVSREIET